MFMEDLLLVRFYNWSVEPWLKSSIMVVGVIPSFTSSSVNAEFAAVFEVFSI